MSEDNKISFEEFKQQLERYYVLSKKFPNANIIHPPTKKNIHQIINCHIENERKILSRLTEFLSLNQSEDITWQITQSRQKIDEMVQTLDCNDKLNKLIEDFPKQLYECYLNDFEKFVVMSFQITHSQQGLLCINNLTTRDFSFLDGYSNKIKEIIITICLQKQEISIFDKVMPQVLYKITTLDEIIDIITIILENNLNDENNEYQCTDRQLNEIMINSSIQKCESNNALKLEKLMNSNLDGDIKITFKFNDIEKIRMVHSFVLIDIYFQKCIFEYNQCQSIIIDIDFKYSEILYSELVKYFYCSNISKDLNQDVLIALHFVGEKYDLKLKDMTLKLLEIENQYRY